MKPDNELQLDVISELHWDPSVNASDIGVEVNDSIVILTGRVDSFGEKWNAEAAAQRVSGVQALVSELDVSLPGASCRNDVDIARAAENVIEWSAPLPKGAVKIKVEIGWITLTGQVHWQYQKEAAASVLRELTGVRRISNQISLKPKVLGSVVKTDIENVLRRYTEQIAQHVTVDVDGAEVTLSGAVQSWPEHQLVAHAAWNAPGVREVINHIVINK